MSSCSQRKQQTALSGRTAVTTHNSKVPHDRLSQLRKQFPNASTTFCDPSKPLCINNQLVNSKPDANMEMMQNLGQLQETAKQFRETKLAALRHPNEFFDYQRVSKPADMNEFTSRLSYNVRYFSANYAVLVALLAVYSLITNPLLLVALGFLIGGFLAISRFVPEPITYGDKTVTPQNLYTALFVLGIPLLWLSAPLSSFFWLVGSSGCLVGAHAGLMEPGIERDYAGAESV